MPFFRLVLLFSLLLLLTLFVQFVAVSAAFQKLGLSPGSAYTLMLTALVDSVVNLPLPRLRNPSRFTAWQPDAGQPVIAVNLGGALIPAAFSLFLWRHSAPGWQPVALSVAVVSTVAGLFSRPIAGLGIAMPILLAPLSAELAANWIAPGQSAALAYISGTIGVLVGAD